MSYEQLHRCILLHYCLMYQCVLYTDIEWDIQKMKRNKRGIDMVTSETIQVSGPEWIDAFHKVC